MKKTFILCLLAISIAIIQGCNTGVVTPEQQHAKRDAIQKFVDDPKTNDPNRESRGR